MKHFIKVLYFLIVCSKSHQNNLNTIEKSINSVISKDHLIPNDCLVQLEMLKRSMSLGKDSWASESEFIR